MSVIVLTPDTYDTIRTVLRHLQNQSNKLDLEIVIVAPRTEAVDLDSPELRGFENVQVVQFADLLSSTAAARAMAVRTARAPLVAFVEDHSFPQPGWAESLIAAHAGPWAAVGPSVGNANPLNPISWANLLIEYAPWLYATSARCIDHLPGHNSSYKRDVLIDYGTTLASMLDAESILHWDLCRKRFQLRLEPAATTLHMNYSSLGDSILLRIHSGRMFAATRARNWHPVRRLAYAGGAPLIPLVRLRRILLEMSQECRRKLPRGTIPVLMLLLVCDGLGELTGYLLGGGNERRRAGKFEFYRHRERLAEIGRANSQTP